MADRVVFKSTDVKVSMEPEVLRASTNSSLKISVYRVNMLGFKVPFSNLEVRFSVEEGSNLIKISDESPKGIATIYSKGAEGEAVLGIYSLKSGLIIKRIILKIMPGEVA